VECVVRGTQWVSDGAQQPRIPLNGILINSLSCFISHFRLTLAALRFATEVYINGSIKYTTTKLTTISVSMGLLYRRDGILEHSRL